MGRVREVIVFDAYAGVREAKDLPLPINTTQHLYLDLTLPTDLPANPPTLGPPIDVLRLSFPSSKHPARWENDLKIQSY